MTPLPAIVINNMEKMTPRKRGLPSQGAVGFSLSLPGDVYGTLKRIADADEESVQDLLRKIARTYASAHETSGAA